MPTQKQRLAVAELAVNGGNKAKAMLKAGYTKITSETPKKLTESKGFKEICEECGLTNNLILKSLVDDIKAKPKNRKSELELGAKIKGMFTTNEVNVHVDMNQLLVSLEENYDNEEPSEQDMEDK